MGVFFVNLPLSLLFFDTTGVDSHLFQTNNPNDVLGQIRIVITRYGFGLFGKHVLVGPLLDFL